MNKILQDIFLACVDAVENGALIHRVSSMDKEFSFQNWFATRLNNLGVQYDEPSRNAYPDFRLVHYPLGFEVKGLGFPGREANYDCNSQVPSGVHHGRTIYYVFGRYPAKTKEPSYPVYDLVLCHGDFLNADHDYIHSNKNLKGFGSYGDLMIRDRKMYVAPTPYALMQGIERQVTLITTLDFQELQGLNQVGAVCRTEGDRLIRGYSFDMISHALMPDYVSNPNAGTTHKFLAFRRGERPGPSVSLR